MYFVHPQIQLKNMPKAKFSLLKSSLRSSQEDIIKEKLSFYMPGKQFIFTDMARSAFKAIIEELKLQNSEMLLPAYICDIFYPIFKSYNIKPIFLDVDLKTFHINPEEVKRKTTPSSRSILVCHTYGLPLDIESVREATDNRLIVIEDCAHAFFAKKGGVYVGNLGDVSFFSLYKQLPSLRGGMLVYSRNLSIKLPKTFFNLRDFISFLNYFWPFAFFFKKFGSEVARKIPRKEKLSQPGGINMASLNLFSDFFDDAKNSLETRKNLALFFQKELQRLGFDVQESTDNVFCYLSVLVPKNMEDQRHKIVQELKKHKVFCTRIWHEPIILNENVQKEYKINLSDFPNTIEAAKRIINFPLQNYYTEKDIRKMVIAIEKVIMDIGYPLI